MGDEQLMGGVEYHNGTHLDVQRSIQKILTGKRTQLTSTFIGHPSLFGCV